jgi:hypothetical protein
VAEGRQIPTKASSLEPVQIRVMLAAHRHQAFSQCNIPSRANRWRGRGVGGAKVNLQGLVGQPETEPARCEAKLTAQTARTHRQDAGNQTQDQN